MTRWNQFLLLCLAVVAMSVAAACTGGDDDDDVATSPTGTLTPLPGSVAEVEPNDSPSTATVVTTGSDANFHGTCSVDTDHDDFFRFMPDSTGNVEVTVAWTEAGANGPDIDVHILDNNEEEIGGDFEVPPGDSPAVAEATITSAGEPHYIRIECFEGSSVFYQGSINQ